MHVSDEYCELWGFEVGLWAFWPLDNRVGVCIMLLHR